jgi:predicted transcriptional regulator
MEQPIIISANKFPNFEEVFASKGRAKIIKLVCRNGEMNISAIMKETKMNHASVAEHLQYFVSIGLIQEKVFGRIKIYRYCIENPKGRALQRLIEFWEQ